MKSFIWRIILWLAWQVLRVILLFIAAAGVVLGSIVDAVEYCIKYCVGNIRKTFTSAKLKKNKG